MAVAASGNGGVIVRVDPAESDMLTRHDRRAGRRGAQPADAGLAASCRRAGATDRELAEWVACGTTHARALSAKR
jgi:hypothetical protein